MASLLGKKIFFLFFFSYCDPKHALEVGVPSDPNATVILHRELDAIVGRPVPERLW